MQKLPPAGFVSRAFQQRPACRDLLGRPAEPREVTSWLLYPRVFEDFARHQATYGDVSALPTPAFLEGIKPSEELACDVERGKTLLIRLLSVGEPHSDATRTVFFELNGQPRSVTVTDKSLEGSTARRPMAKPGEPNEVGAPMSVSPVEEGNLDNAAAMHGEDRLCHCIGLPANPRPRRRH